MLKNAMATKRWYDAMLRCYDAMVKNAMAVKRWCDAMCTVSTEYRRNGVPGACVALLASYASDDAFHTAAAATLTAVIVVRRPACTSARSARALAVSATHTHASFLFNNLSLEEMTVASSTWIGRVGRTSTTTSASRSADQPT